MLISITLGEKTLTQSWLPTFWKKEQNAQKVNKLKPHRPIAVLLWTDPGQKREISVRELISPL